MRSAEFSEIRLPTFPSSGPGIKRAALGLSLKGSPTRRIFLQSHPTLCPRAKERSAGRISSLCQSPLLAPPLQGESVGCRDRGRSKRVLFSNDRNVVGYVIGILILSSTAQGCEGLCVCCLVRCPPPHLSFRAEPADAWARTRGPWGRTWRRWAGWPDAVVCPAASPFSASRGAGLAGGAEGGPRCGEASGGLASHTHHLGLVWATDGRGWAPGGKTAPCVPGSPGFASSTAGRTLLWEWAGRGFLLWIASFSLGR